MLAARPFRIVPPVSPQRRSSLIGALSVAAHAGGSLEAKRLQLVIKVALDEENKQPGSQAGMSPSSRPFDCVRFSADGRLRSPNWYQPLLLHRRVQLRRYLRSSLASSV